MRFCLVIYALLLCGLGVSISQKFVDGDPWRPGHARPASCPFPSTQRPRRPFLFPLRALDNDAAPSPSAGHFSGMIISISSGFSEAPHLIQRALYLSLRSRAGLRF